MKINKNTIKKGLYVVLGIGLILGAVGLVRNLINKDDDGFDKVNLSYSIGGLDENGKYEETKGSLYTKNAIELNTGDELQFTLDFENDIQYQLYFYDGNDEFVSSSEVLTKNYKHVAESDTSVRVLITPIWDEDVEEEKQTINLFTMSKYTSQLSVEVKVFIGNPLFTIKQSIFLSEDRFAEFEEGMTWSEWIESDYNTMGIKIDSGFVDYAGTAISFYDEDGGTTFVLPDSLISSTLDYVLTSKPGND